MAKCRFCKSKTDEPVIRGIYKFCSISHATEFTLELLSKQRAKNIAKAKQVRANTIKVNRKAVKDLNRKSLKWQHKQTQPVFNKLRRLQEFKWFSDRGLEPVCISCGKPIGNDQWCNGHFKSVGANGRLRYDFKNSYLQHNQYCNMQLSGDAKRYEPGLITRFGEEDGQAIIDYCETNNKPIKRTWQDLEELRSTFNKLVKELT